LPIVTNLRVSSSWAAAEKTGTPDYQQNAFKASIRAKIPLEANQQFNFFMLMCSDIASAWAHVTPRLAVGATANLINAVTGLPTPYVVAAGHIDEWIMNYWSFEQIARLHAYIDGQFVLSNYADSSSVNYQQMVSGMDTSLLDPTGILPHAIDLTLENITSDPLDGLVMIVHIESIVGSPPFLDIKDIRCKFCGHITKDVNVMLTKNTCSECGMTTFYWSPVRGKDG